MPWLGESLSEEFNDMWRRFVESDNQPTTSIWRPRIDVIDKPECFTVQVEIPGLSAEDIDVTLSGNDLMISGERKEPERAEGENYRVCERRHGKFRRSFTLPSAVKADHLKAELKDGILNVTVQKAETVKHARITVKAG
jgi:HSP20 family protein